MGLAGRSELSEGQGMLFSFASQSERQVWMAGMKFQIDVAWIADHRVIVVQTLDPCTEAEHDRCPRWTSPNDVDALTAAARTTRTIGAGTDNEHTEPADFGEIAGTLSRAMATTRCGGVASSQTCIRSTFIATPIFRIYILTLECRRSGRQFTRRQ